MLETCRGGPRAIRSCVEKTFSKILMKFNHRGPVGKHGGKF